MTGISDQVPRVSPWRMSLDDLSQGTSGKIRASKQREFTGIGTDTRENLNGKIFVALKGENYDAHDFLAAAVKAGAAALLVHRLPDSAQVLLDQVSIVEV